ncbi:smalltalk protein [Hoylesella buccalis]|nr:smalltalk protein [Hoylesella buccalis]UEA62441.1 smalltalk protein [Hoylesella buccalis]UWP50276.1 smalltalk protein [Hoylesella buccalis ATCC 35310]
MKRINWKLIFKLIITIATAILGMLTSQDKLPYNEN